MNIKEVFSKKIKEVRLKRGLTQQDVTIALGYESKSYVSDVENGYFIPGPDKLTKWAKALGMTREEMDSLLADAKLEDMGLTDPGFTMMFKEVPNMTAKEKESIIASYKKVMKARSAKERKK